MADPSFPRKPNDAEEREAAAYRSFAESCDARWTPYRCTRSYGHAGDHIAVSLGWTGMEVFARWPQTPAPSAETKDICPECRATSDDVYHRDGCSRTRQSFTVYSPSARSDTVDNVDDLRVVLAKELRASILNAGHASESDVYKTGWKNGMLNAIGIVTKDIRVASATVDYEGAWNSLRETMQRAEGKPKPRWWPSWNFMTDSERAAFGCVARRVENAMRHVDDFIDDPTSDRDAANWFKLFRRPELVKIKEPNSTLLFTTYRGQRYRVTGCSRMGDVWLHSALDWHEMKHYQWYERRVDVDECSDWNAEEPVSMSATKGPDGDDTCGS